MSIWTGPLGNHYLCPGFQLMLEEKVSTRGICVTLQVLVVCVIYLKLISDLIKSASKLNDENMYNICLGCVKEVIINNKVVDFLQAANVRHKVSPGCSQYQDQGDDEQIQDATENPCQNGRHKCRNGAKCLPKQPTSIANVPYGNQLPPSPADLYECRCTEHFEGKFCENRRK